MTTNNTVKTVFLLVALTALMVFVGRLIGGTGGMTFAFALALVMNFVAYWFSDKMALAMAGAKEVAESEAPELHRLVEQLASYARLPKPRVHIIDNPSPNAFATGRDPQHAAVAVTTGILNLLGPKELAGVLSHELAHIKNRDTLIATIVAAMAGAIMIMADMARWAMIFGGSRGEDEEEGGAAGLVGGLLMIILAPIAAMLIQLAISRAREYGADATGARISSQPLALASALEKLEMGVSMRPMAVNTAAAHLFIVNPLTGGGLMGLFSTHPPIADRAARLREMALRPSAYGIMG